LLERSLRSWKSLKHRLEEAGSVPLDHDELRQAVVMLSEENESLERRVQELEEKNLLLALSRADGHLDQAPEGGAHAWGEVGAHGYGTLPAMGEEEQIHAAIAASLETVAPDPTRSSDEAKEQNGPTTTTTAAGSDPGLYTGNSTQPKAVDTPCPEHDEEQALDEAPDALDEAGTEAAGTTEAEVLLTPAQVVGSPPSVEAPHQHLSDAPQAFPKTPPTTPPGSDDADPLETGSTSDDDQGKRPTGGLIRTIRKSAAKTTGVHGAGRKIRESITNSTKLKEEAALLQVLHQRERERENAERESEHVKQASELLRSAHLQAQDRPVHPKDEEPTAADYWGVNEIRVFQVGADEAETEEEEEGDASKNFEEDRWKDGPDYSIGPSGIEADGSWASASAHRRSTRAPPLPPLDVPPDPSAPSTDPGPPGLVPPPRLSLAAPSPSGDGVMQQSTIADEDDGFIGGAPLEFRPKILASQSSDGSISVPTMPDAPEEPAADRHVARKSILSFPRRSRRQSDTQQQEFGGAGDPFLVEDQDQGDLAEIDVLKHATDGANQRKRDKRRKRNDPAPNEDYVPRVGGDGGLMMMLDNSGAASEEEEPRSLGGGHGTDGSGGGGGGASPLPIARAPPLMSASRGE